MKVIKLPENGTDFVPYEVDGNIISFNDEEIMMNLKKKERDEEVTIDVVEDWQGGLIFSADGGERYVAQISIPPRQYKEVVKTVEEMGEEKEETVKVPVPFDIDRCILKLYAKEV